MVTRSKPHPPAFSVPVSTGFPLGLLAQSRSTASRCLSLRLSAMEPTPAAGGSRHWSKISRGYAGTYSGGCPSFRPKSLMIFSWVELEPQKKTKNMCVNLCWSSQTREKDFKPPQTFFLLDWNVFQDLPKSGWSTIFKCLPTEPHLAYRELRLQCRCANRLNVDSTSCRFQKLHVYRPTNKASPIHFTFPMFSIKRASNYIIACKMLLKIKAEATPHYITSQQSSHWYSAHGTCKKIDCHDLWRRLT